MVAEVLSLYYERGWHGYTFYPMHIENEWLAHVYAAKQWIQISYQNQENMNLSILEAGDDESSISSGITSWKKPATMIGF